MPKYYGHGLIGLDVKPRRRNSPCNRNRYKSYYFRWLFPVILGLLTMGIIAIAGAR